MNRRYLLLLLLVLFSAYLTVKRNYSAVLSMSDSRTSVFSRYLPTFDNYYKKKEFEKLVDTTSNVNGAFGIYIKEIDSNREYTSNKTEVFYAASLFKIPIAVSALKLAQEGKINLDTTVRYTLADYEAGTGTINMEGIGNIYTLDELLKRLIKDSDNVAQNMLIREIGMTQLSDSFSLISIENHFFDRNTLTPEQMGQFLENLLTHNYLNSTYLNKFLDLMTVTAFDNRISKGISGDIKFAHKIGNGPDPISWHDCGIAEKNKKRVIVCLMSRNTSFEEFLEVSKNVGEFVNYLF